MGGFGLLVSLSLPLAINAQITKRDSAGITFVTISSGLTTTVPVLLESRPFLQLGVLRDDPREELSAPPSLLKVVRTPDGDVLVADGVWLKRFDSSGRIIGQAGGRGRGPGEYVQIRQVCQIRGDSLLVLDQSLGRVTLLDKDLKHVRTTERLASLEFDGCFGNGSVLVRGTPYKNPASTFEDRVVMDLDLLTPYSRIARDGSTLADFGSLPFESMTTLRRYINAVVRKDTVYFTSSDRAELKVFQAGGKLVRVVRWRPSNVRNTPDLRRKRSGRIRSTVVAGDRVAQAPSDVPADQFQRFMPEFGGMLVDHEGRLWLEDYPFPGVAPGWTVMTGEGSVLGRLQPLRIQGFSDIRLAALIPKAAVFSAIDGDGARYLLFFHIRELARTP